MNKPPKRSPIALAALAMLYEAPMHPYRMQYLLKERGKDAVINVAQRAGLYQTITRLEREGLIAKERVMRDDNRPERTDYQITETGRATMIEWMRSILSASAQEFPEFPAAVSFLALLAPEDALHQLEVRTVHIQAQMSHIDKALKQAEFVPRLFLLEIEYLRTIKASELSWVSSVIEELRSGALTWSETWLRQVIAQFADVNEAGFKSDE